jgi:hypothetical protein
LFMAGIIVNVCRGDTEYQYRTSPYETEGGIHVG